MAIMLGAHKPKFQCGSLKVKKIYKGTAQVYSSGNIVTYHVDTGITYQEEVDEGASCLSPKTFIPAKSGWTFVGWRSDASANANVHQSLGMGDDPVVLYAVFRQAVTVTYYNGSTAASSTSGYRYYNSGNIANPSFTLTQAALSGWTARGWSASGAANGGIAYANGAAFTRDSSITLYGMYQQTIALTTVANGSSSTQYGTRYYNSNGNSINPVFTVSTPSLSGANWLGWCNSAGTVLYSSISNLALSASTTLYSGFKYPDSGPHTLTWTAASTKPGEEPNTSNVAGSPVINGNLYETAYIYDCNMTGVYVSGGHGSNNWTVAQARYYVGDNYVSLANASLESGVPHNSNWNGLSANIPIKKGFSGYLQLNITLTLGADWSRCYMGNSAAYGARMILRGRTVIG